VLSLHGTERAYFAEDERGMTQPVEISGSGIYVETHMDANRANRVCRAAIELFGYPYDDLQIETVPSSTTKS
jgi:negative regulator of replication initiation